MINQIITIAPEIFLAIIAMGMQIVGVFSKASTRKIVLITVMLGGGLVCYLLCFTPTYYELAFSHSFATSTSIVLFKAIILALTLMTLLIYRDLAKIAKKPAKMEFVTLILLSTLGAFIAISARDFMLLFCGLELQSLAGYALAAFNTKKVKSSEAGLKYFVLGALMSCVLLLGISFLYGYSGSIRFIDIRPLSGGSNIGLTVGSILVIASLLFKLSAAPLHMWTPDVYEGAPISSVSYFATSQKLAILLVLINILDAVVGDYTIITNDLIKIAAIASMIIGALGAIRQFSIKRLMAYSTILNVGYTLIGVCLHSAESNYTAFLYMLIYVIGAIGFWACLVSLCGTNSDEATFDDLKGVAATRKTVAAVISIIMFSMIGLPPLAGFFGKYYIFYNAVMQGEIILAMIGVITSVIAAFYYLKIIKYMYFMEAQYEIRDRAIKSGLRLVIVISLSFTLFFCTFAYKYIS